MVKDSFTKVTPMIGPELPEVKRMLRKTYEGFKPDCVVKGSKVGSGEKVAHFMVAISHQKGDLICEQIKKMNGAYFAGFIHQNFKSIFQTIFYLFKMGILAKIHGESGLVG